MSFDQPPVSPNQGNEFARLLEHNTELLIAHVRVMYSKRQVLGALQLLGQSPSGQIRVNKHCNVRGSNRIMAVKHYQHVTGHLFAVRDLLLPQQPSFFQPSDPYKGIPRRHFANDARYLGEAIAHVQSDHVIIGIIDSDPEMLSVIGTEADTTVPNLILQTLENDQRTVPLHEFADRNREAVPKMLIEFTRHLLSRVKVEEDWRSMGLKWKT